MGSFEIEHGICRSMELAPEAPETWRRSLEKWKQDGIPVTYYQGHSENQTHTQTSTSIPLNSANALRALETWVRDHDGILLLVPHALMEYWDGLSTWPISTMERFETLAALLRTEKQYLLAWDELFRSTSADFTRIRERKSSLLKDPV